MARCGCGGTCTCLVTAGSGVQVEGIGSVENPYVVSSDSPELIGRLVFDDSATVDFTTTGTGTAANPTHVTAHTTVEVEDLTDVSGIPSNGQVLVWSEDHWEPQDQTGGSGVPPGGTDGQVLTKASDVDGDAVWEDPTGGGAVMEPITHGAWTASALSLTTGAATKVPFGTVIDAPTGGLAIAADGTVTIPSDGYYQINAAIAFAANTTGTRYGYIFVNGGTRERQTTTAGDSVPTVKLAKCWFLTAGSTVDVRAFQNSGANLAIDTTNSQTNLDITKVPALSPGGGGVVVERPVAASLRYSSAFALTTGASAIVPFDTEVFSEGVTWNAAGFVVPSAGYYDVEFGVTFAANNTGARVGYITVNGSAVHSINGGNGTDSQNGVTGSATIKCVAGDLVAIRALQSSGANLNLGGASNYNFVTIAKVPAAYAGSAVSTYGEQNYSASYRQGAAISLPSGVITQVPWDTLDYADGIAKDAAGIFTVPVAGYYNVNVKVGFAQNANGYRRIRLLQNSASSGPGYGVAAPMGAATSVAVLSRTVKCAAGDTLQVQVDQNSGVALDVYASTPYNSIDITKVPAPVVNGAAASGMWGVGPLDSAIYGTDSLVGREVYIDSKGQLRTKPETPAARVNRYKTTQLNLTASTWTTVPFETEEVPTNAITYANGVFTIQRAGVYEVNTQVLFSGIGSGQARVRILISGNAKIEAVLNGQDSTLSGSKSYPMAVGDTISVMAWANVSAAYVPGSAARYTNIDITRIAA